MINEEDHLRIQVLHSGLALEECWKECDHLDDQIEASVPYAFHPQFGYLTACPTNCGHRHSHQRHAASARPASEPRHPEGQQHGSKA
jgi:protein-arginine kinase